MSLSSSGVKRPCWRKGGASGPCTGPSKIAERGGGPLGLLIDCFLYSLKFSSKALVMNVAFASCFVGLTDRDEAVLRFSYKPRSSSTTRDVQTLDRFSRKRGTYTFEL